MKYLSLERSELKELIYLKIGAFSLSLTIIILSGIALGLISFQLSHSLPLALLLGIAFIVGGIFIIFFTNRAYFEDISKKEKRVYRGVISQKKIILRNNKKSFAFNVDGNIFLVDEENYTKFEEGEVLEFHVSPGLKHLFRIDRVAM
jgi:hypothetical protein